MKVAIFENPRLENLRVEDVKKPELTLHNVLIKVKRETVVNSLVQAGHVIRMLLPLHLQ
jgi:NADPH:quinone reductase-like Zn-dependent oxidoreductase